MKILPAVPDNKPRDVFQMTMLSGLESVTRALRYGKSIDYNELRPLAQRCRALSNAFDERVKLEHERNNR